MTGPLRDLRVVEIGSVGPGPFAAMVLRDLGADVVRIERPVTEKGTKPAASDLLRRGRDSVPLDLKDPKAVEGLLDLVSFADVMLEGFRPGVAERLGIGPGPCLSRNPGLVYGRMTGWGQTGPLANEVGHDINYVAVSGMLAEIGRAGAPPTVPLNLLGDYGGGAMLLLVGILAALEERHASGLGQVIDAAMLDGVSLLGQVIWSWEAQGRWRQERGTNLLDGGAPFYDTYRCADGGYLAVGALEPQYYCAFLRGLGLADDRDLPDRDDRSQWPTLRTRLAERISERTRDEWVACFAGMDACVSPVLSRSEAAQHPHLMNRATIIEVDGVRQAAPAPRFSRTPARRPTSTGTSTTLTSVRRAWGQKSDGNRSS